MYWAFAFGFLLGLMSGWLILCLYVIFTVGGRARGLR